MDLTTQIAAAIDGWLHGLAAELLAPALDAVGRLLFSTPTFDTIAEINATWSLVRGIADSLFVLAFLAIGILVTVAAGDDVRYSSKVLVPRVVLAAACANASLTVCGALIGLNNGLVEALVGAPSGATVFAELADLVLAATGHSGMLGTLVALAAAVVAVVLVALYLGRDLLLAVAVVVAPLAIAAAAVPSTAEFARVWARLFGSLLFVQVIQALLVVVGVQLVRHLDWLARPAPQIASGLVLVTLLYLLLHLPFAACRWALGRPIGFSAPAQQRSPVAARIAA